MKARLFLPLLLCAALCACASVPLDRQILNANDGVTTVLTATDSALLAHLISPAQAQSVSTITHQVSPLIDSAHAAALASDTAGATHTMTLVNALLAGLKAYVPPAPTQ